jgi:hypothetical protein
VETRQSIRTAPTRPIALAIAALSVLALALTSWYVFGSRAQSGSPGFVQVPRSNHLPLNCSNDPYSPQDPICTPYHDPYSPHDPVN